MHCILRASAEGPAVEDVSTNGTFLDGLRLGKAGDKKRGASMEVAGGLGGFGACFVKRAPSGFVLVEGVCSVYLELSAHAE